MKKPRRCAIIGATGMAGQQFIDALSGHPWFDVVSLHGSSTVGLSYKEARKGFNNA